MGIKFTDSKRASEKNITVGQFTAPWSEDQEAWIFPGGEKITNRTCNAYKEALAAARRYSMKIVEANKKNAKKACQFI